MILSEVRLYAPALFLSLGGQPSSWAQYIEGHDMGFPHEKAKGKRPPVKKDKPKKK